MKHLVILTLIFSAFSMGCKKNPSPQSQENKNFSWEINNYPDFKHQCKVLNQEYNDLLNDSGAADGQMLLSKRENITKALNLIASTPRLYKSYYKLIEQFFQLKAPDKDAIEDYIKLLHADCWALRVNNLWSSILSTHKNIKTNMIIGLFKKPFTTKC